MQRIEISKCDRCCLAPCCFEGESKNSKNQQKLIKYELMKAAEEQLDTKTEITELFKIIDQFRLLKKIFLNENQCFMLDNREIQNIYNNKMKRTSKEIFELNEEKFKKKKNKFYEYITAKTIEKSLSQIDELLLKYLDDEIKAELAEE